MAPRVGLKICGVTRAEDLLACAELGVDAVGLNLWPGSRRALTLDQASALVERWPRPGPERIGVFVDPTIDEVMRATEALALDAIQLHGDRPIEPYAALGIPYLWVVRGTPPLAELRPPTPAPSRILLDAAVAGYGGAGVRTDWVWAKAAVAALAPAEVWLAGGITPANAASALAEVGPAGLDVASGAEREGARHGEKDRDRIAALVAIVRAHRR
ncbi:MAG: phosphoribosylanthranilate isomerase [Myxococcales bacterium]|nr:phosphoribosylanthranilate isomerase [Myxococcales bacterium]MCB9705629.1 phosphoribosylanthranilate isomerase [Myxococcales bacterium]